MSDVERPEMTLRDYWRVLVRRKWIVIAAIVAAVAPAVALTMMQDPMYQSSADMIIRTRAGESLFGTGNQVYVDPDRVVQNEIAVLQGGVVYDKVIENLGLDEAPPGAVGYSSDSTDVITVSVDSGDPETAAILADAYIDAYIDVKREQAVSGLDDAGAQLQAQISKLQTQIEALDTQLAASDDDDDSVGEAQRRSLVDQQASFRQTFDQLQIDAALSSGSAELIRPAYVPTEPFAPTPERTAMLAVVVGLLLGLGAAFLIDYLDDSVRGPDDLTKLGGDRPVLAVVPVDVPPDHRPVALSKPDDFAVEAYRTLRTNVQFLGIERSVNVIQITSSLPGEGKTTTATNLAVVLAQAGNSVVLIDADLRKPRIHRVFAIDGSLGLTNNLVGESVDMTIQPVGDHLSVITSGPVPPNPSEMLSGQRMEGFIDELKRRFDYVVVDSAPTLSVSDAVALSRHVDGVLVVVQAGRTSLPQVRETLATLEQVSAPVLGLVLNKAVLKRAADDEYGYSYNQPYGERPRADAAAR